MMFTQEDIIILSQMFDTKLNPIFQELDVLKKDVTDLKEDVAVLKEEVTDLKEDVTVLKEDVTDLKEDVKVINLKMENIIQPQIQLLAENYVPAAKRYEKESEHIERMQSDIDVMKRVIEGHSVTLQELA